MISFEAGKEIAQVELHSLHLHDGLHIPELMLSEAEKVRAAAFRSPEARRMFVAGRTLCRSIVSRITDCTPAALSIAITPSGRPYLPDHPDIDFNLSHSGNMVVLAVSRGGHVGVDIEPLNLFSEAEGREILPLILSAQELNDLHHLTSQQRQNEFLSHWVRKEAALKCLGDGFLADPQSVTISRKNTTFGIIESPPGEAVFVHSGRLKCGSGSDLQWAVATSTMIAEPIWRHNLDLAHFMRVV